jgi:hypothetical protein
VFRKSLLGAAALMLIAGQAAQAAPSGAQSNRAALALAGKGSAKGVRTPSRTEDSSELRGGSGSGVIVALLAVGAVILGIIAATSGDSSPNSP